MATQNDSNLIGRRVAWIVLLLLALGGLAIVVVPVWVIQPFKPQSPRGMALSYALRRWSPMLTVVALIFSFLLIAWLWRGSRRWWRKAVLVVITLPMLASTWFARQNHFEWMFRPLSSATYAKAAEASFVTDSDMVL